MEIKFRASPNYKTGRKGRKVIAIVNHITAGSMPGCLAWMQNPDSKASAHYLITRAGEIFQLVRDEDTAYHAGIANKPTWGLYDGSNPNYYTLGIEHECLGGGELTEAQYQASLWIHGQLIGKYNFPIDNNHIIGHYRIDSVNRPNCPGPNFPWARLFKDLKGGVNLDVNQALTFLLDKGVITNIEYWKKTTEVVKYQDQLLINMATALQK